MADKEQHKMSAKSRMRSKRKKIEIKKKEFKYHGMSLEEVQKLSIDELIPILPSRARRTLKRGLTKTQDKLLRDIEKTKYGDPIKTHCRNMIILPRFIGHKLDVHNGAGFQRVDIQPHMIGHCLGEFALTRKRVKHTGPGVGATRGSKYMPLK